MKILVAPASYKGFMLAHNAARAMARGLAAAGFEFVLRPVADGGEGTLECLRAARGGRFVAARTENAWGRPIPARILHWAPAGEAFVELAQAVGWSTARRRDWDVGQASTYGVGLLVKAALDLDVRRITVTLGGSLTNDAGAGLLEALGARLLSGDGRPLGRGGLALAGLSRLDLDGLDPRLATVSLTVLADVEAPLVGPDGASMLFSRQKGASADTALALEGALTRFRDVAGRIRPVDGPFSGAAGGTAAALLLLGADVRLGAEEVMRRIDFDQALKATDALITGEGRFDRQSLKGKAPAQALLRAHQLGKPAAIILGKASDDATPLPFDPKVSYVAPHDVPASTVRREMRRLLGERAAEAGRSLAEAPRLTFVPPPRGGEDAVQS